jgi:hypothetical protein
LGGRRVAVDFAVCASKDGVDGANDLQERASR